MNRVARHNNCLHVTGGIESNIDLILASIQGHNEVNTGDSIQAKDTSA